MTRHDPDLTAERLIELLGLKPHPEGGCYVETYRAPADAAGGRGAVTAIYFLLREGERSHWHTVDAVEIWLWHGGAPLELSVYDERGGACVERHRLGLDLVGGERPQAVVPVGAWQAARSLGGWSLVSCTVAPAFDFAGFRMAPPGWEPPVG
ncbi:cupin domain-containing protein [Azospirillum sp. TSO35-2]|uniref:cupin domain-containing protein n=1 Tax=Azospirillum sp. TSO35-2 TaxID=716796 RepID=UPI000D61034C|nr:cupin domain-containing protein [Azospirillum sp. TSO35-2]PWC36320.1 cupin [Azospirillum sp. TSO35-2]